jgi:KUP system potassium uptake protein
MYRTAFMVFWTWAKGLEDEFDGANRRNLRHFISKVISEKPVPPPPQHLVTSGGIEFVEEYLAAALSDHAPPDEPQDVKQTVQLFLDTEEQDKIPLPRMSTMAIFHKLSSGKGVPHTFYGFLRCWPALPQVVVSSFLNLYIVRPHH